MPPLRWSQVKSISVLRVTFGVVVSYFMQWSADFCLLKTLRLRIYTKRSWPANLRSHASSQQIALTLSLKFYRQTQRKGTELNRFESTPGTVSFAINSLVAYFQARNLYLWKTRSTSRFLTSSVSTPTTPWSALRPIVTTISRRLTTCCTSEPFASKSLSLMLVWLREVSIVRQLPATNETKLLITLDRQPSEPLATTSNSMIRVESPSTSEALALVITIPLTSFHTNCSPWMGDQNKPSSNPIRIKLSQLRNSTN